MKKQWIVVGAIIILLVISVFTYLKTTESESSQAPQYIPIQPPSLSGEIISVEKAQNTVPFKIIEPKYLPTSFKLLGASVRKEKIMLLYEDSSSRKITISEWISDEYVHQPYPGEKEVIIDGKKGWFSIPGPYNLLWTCDNIIISLSADILGGREASEDEILKIANSMVC